MTGAEELFQARLERWLPDLEAALAPLFDDPAEVRQRLVQIAAKAFAARPEELHALDLKRSLAPDWFQREDMVGYAAYADRFAGTLQGVAERTAYLADLGVTYLHLMPLLTPREGPNDGGYAVQDYDSVRPDLGTMDDLRDLTRVLREHGISLCLDLVLNHVAREHAWAERARQGDPRYRAYFHVYDDRTTPDEYERTLPEVFPDFAPGNFTWDDELDGWVWTTFNDYQWDVNWSNPDVLCEYAEIILNLANHGVEVLRLDAIAFIWKRMGTACQNQPEVHALTQALRTVDADRRPGDAVQGRGDRRPAGPAGLPRTGRAPRQGQRPRLPQQPDGADLVDAGQPRRRPRGVLPAAARRRRRAPPPGSPTPAATTTSAGPSTTTALPRSGSAATATGSSSPTSTPATSRGRGRAGWCSRRTR